MQISNEQNGLVLICDHLGYITDVILNDFDIPLLTPGMKFIELADENNITKAQHFLLELKIKKAVLGWEINVVCSNKIETLQFFGGAMEKDIIILASDNYSGIVQYYEELMKINNDQIVKIREVLKDHISSIKNQSDNTAEASVYNEFTKLNNELVKMQREMSKKNIQLEKTNEQKNYLLGVAAHDLRNPLLIISNYSEHLLEDLKEKVSDKDIDMLKTIKSSSDFMYRLVDDLLDMSKIDAGKMELEREETDIIELFGTIININKVFADKKNIDVVFNHIGEIPKLFVDPLKLTQVMNNLLNNAVKYSFPYTQITVSLRKLEEELLVTVKDKGRGIPDERIKNLFKPFQTAQIKSTAKEKSTGLGLAIVKNIIKVHGGRIWVESEVGSGSSFYFTLPLKAPELIPNLRKKEEKIKNYNIPEDIKKLKVLIIEDDLIITKIITAILTKFGYSIKSAETGEQGIEEFRRGNFDLIITDLSLSGIDGYETVERIRELEGNEHTGIIISSGLTSSEDKDKAYKAGADEFIVKPFKKNDFISALKRMNLFI